MIDATRHDLPFQNTSQAQCCLCWRMFSSDGNAEQHKPYARAPEDQGKRGRVALREECTPPEQLGMTPIERNDGVIVWGFISQDEFEARLDRMGQARAARKANTNGG